MTVRENFEAVKEFLIANGADPELIDFMTSRIAQDEKAKENAKKKRLEKNGGEKKDPAYSEYYTNLRNAVLDVMTGDPQTGAELATKAGVSALAAQVALALKPAIADGTVVKEDVVVEFTNKKGLVNQTVRTGYKRA